MSDVHHTVSTSEEFAEVTVIQGSARRRYFPPEVKARIVEENMDPAVSLSAVARRHGLNQDTQLARRWREGSCSLGCASCGSGSRRARQAPRRRPPRLLTVARGRRTAPRLRWRRRARAFGWTRAWTRRRWRGWYRRCPRSTTAVARPADAPARARRARGPSLRPCPPGWSSNSPRSPARASSRRPSATRSRAGRG